MNNFIRNLSTAGRLMLHRTSSARRNDSMAAGMAQRSPDRTCIVIGNGPSLRGFDFGRLEGLHTLGMNAAYRHWDRIGWYPTYYCCLDDQLIQTHHLEIKRLVEREQVAAAFVHGSFFELHPECIADDRFWSSDQFHPYWYKNRGKATGREFIDSVAFKTADPSKITSGAYAVRFCAFLGYETIGLLGIDLRYVEILPEAERGDGIALRMRETPTHNPNYFFDDYQRAGDRYNLPNPDVHQGDLHLSAFRVLRDDFFESDIGTDVINCNPGSALRDAAIFRYEPLEKLTGSSQLGAVVVPCTAGERDQILANFQLWAQPAFAPFLSSSRKSRPKLVFIFNRMTNSLRADIIRKFRQLSLDRFFSEIIIHSLELQGEADAYIRSYDRPSGLQGYKAGPNNQFFESMRRVSKDCGRYVFLMETDCVPIRPDWLGRLTDIVDGSEPFFILGSAYRGISPLSKSFGKHINGNAVYAAGDQEFIDFLNEVWEPALRSAIAREDRRLAYDCILEAVFSRARSDLKDDDTWRLWQKTAHKFRYSDFIQNISGNVDIDSAKQSMVREILVDNPDTYIIHNQALARAACNLLATRQNPQSVDLNPSPGGIATVSQPDFAGFHFVSTYSSALVERQGDKYLLPAGSSGNYLMCKFTGVIQEGDSVLGTLKFKLDQASTLTISLCRDGDGTFESSKKVDEYSAGTHEIQVEHTFRNGFRGARFQIGAENQPTLFTLISAKLEKVVSDYPTSGEKAES